MPEPRERSTTDESETVNVVFAVTNYGDWPAGTQLSYQGDREMLDYVDAAFHSRRSKGEVFNNPCELVVNKRYHSDISGSSTHYDIYNPTSQWTLTSGNQTDWALTTQSQPYQIESINEGPVIGTAVDDAKQFALARVDSTPYEFAEDLGEIGETIRFLKSPLSSIMRVLKAYKRKKKAMEALWGTGRATAEEIRAAADLWATYRFALAPLVRSVMSATEVFEKFEDIERPARRSAHGWGKEFSNPNTELFLGFRPYGPADMLNFNYARTSTLEKESHAAIYYEVSNPIVDWKFALGLRLKDIPTTAWELVPLSFMVDRLVNIKSMIAGLLNLADPTVTILAGSVTSKTSRKADISLTNWFSGLGTLSVTMHKADSVSIEQFTYARELWEPAAIDTIPNIHPLGLVDSVTEILDLLAIIVKISRY